MEPGHGVKDELCCLGNTRMLESRIDVPVSGSWDPGHCSLLLKEGQAPGGGVRGEC